MHRGGAAAEQAMIIKQLGRGATVEGLGSGVLGRLLAEVDMQRTLPCRLADLAESLGRYGANRVHSGADAYLVSFGELARPGPASDRHLHR